MKTMRNWAAALALGWALLGCEGTEPIVGSDNVFVLPNAVFTVNERMIADNAHRLRIPVIGIVELQPTEMRALFFYGPSLLQAYRESSRYVDRILKGANPAELPVEQPTKFYFVVNLKMARTLGIAIPQTVLFRADQVIE